MPIKCSFLFFRSKKLPRDVYFYELSNIAFFSFVVDNVLSKGPVVHEEMGFIRLLIWSSGSPCVQRSRNIYAIFVEGNTVNILVKLFPIWTSGSGGDIV